MQANIELKKSGGKILDDAELTRHEIDELGRPLQGVINNDKCDTLHDQNLLAAKDLEIVELQNQISKLKENRNQIDPLVVDIF